MPIENAIYTDVTAAESVSGRDGFQFQSVSPGFSEEDRARAESELVFVPTPYWVREHGDETTHPRQASFTVHEGRLYFARARALGLTANHRPGNQLTEFAAAPSGDDISPYNPAQFLAARDWTLEKESSQRREAWVTPVTIDPRLEDDALEGMPRDDPWTAMVLPAFLAMLRRSLTEPGHRVFVQHHDLDEVLRWVALGSMLLDSESALRLTFRAFHLKPWSGDFRVVGVHPKIQQLDPANDWKSTSAASWIELDTRSVDDTTPGPLDEAAVRWLRDHGAFDARNAIEVAHRLEPSMGPKDAVDAAELLAFGAAALGARAAEVAVSAITALARAHDTDTLDAYEDELLDPLTMHRAEQDHEFLRIADAVAALAEAGLIDSAAELVTPTLESLAATPQHASVFAQRLGRIPRALTWTDREAHEQASRSWATSITTAPATTLAALFTATGRLGLRLDPDRFAPALQRLAEQWASDPTTGTDRASWYERAQVERRTAQRVADDLTAGDVAQRERLLTGTWDDLVHLPDSPLAHWGRARDLALSPVKARIRALEASDSGTVAAATRPLVVGELTLPLEAELVAAFVHAAGVDDQLAEDLHAAITQQLKSPSMRTNGARTKWSVVFDALIRVREAGLYVGNPLSEVVDAVLIGRTCRRKPNPQPRDMPSPPLSGGIGIPPARLWALDDPQGTGRMLVQMQDRDAAETVAAGLGPWAQEALWSHLRSRTRSDGAVKTARMALRAYRASPQGELLKALGSATRGLLDAHPEIERSARKDAELADLILRVQTDPHGAARKRPSKKRRFGQGNR